MVGGVTFVASFRVLCTLLGVLFLNALSLRWLVAVYKLSVCRWVILEKRRSERLTVGAGDEP